MPYTVGREGTELEAPEQKADEESEAGEMEGPKVVPASYGDNVRSLTLLHAVIEPGRDQSAILSGARASNVVVINTG